jgi:hypothetical protein
MKKITTLILLFLISLLLINCNSKQYADSVKKESSTNLEKLANVKNMDLTPSQKAVKLAEEFIARNGYTKKTADKEDISHESIEWSENNNELLKQRHDTLQPNAYGYSEKNKGNKKGWTVVFLYSDTSEIKAKIEAFHLKMVEP